MLIRDIQIAPPRDWATFENLCHALFKEVWRDPLAQKHGRRGQAQQGVDIVGSPDGDRQIRHGVQCKGKDLNYGGVVEWDEVVSEIAKAEAFTPQLTEWVFATTAPVDAALQRAAWNLSVERRSKGLFAVEILGWEEIQALMARAPKVVEEFYPEHAGHLQEAINALRILPTLQEKLAKLAEELTSRPTQLAKRDASAMWEAITFGNDRGLGPALMGYSMGPSDAKACPKLAEVDTILNQLKIAYSARLVGEPGAGKSICAHQVALLLSTEGFEVFRLLDPHAEFIGIDAGPDDQRRVWLIDDAHLLPPQVLNAVEGRASKKNLFLSTHNAVEGVSHRGAITLDPKRAVRTIAAALRKDLRKTLEAVRLADDRVGERAGDLDISRRLDEAEKTASRPWQFCFILGGGWRRSRREADAARAAAADITLAAIALRQLASRDARAKPSQVLDVIQGAGIDDQDVATSLDWLAQQRMILTPLDCRTPHQQFAAVVLGCILEGQDNEGRKAMAAMLNHILCDRQFPIAGIRALLFELQFGNNFEAWKFYIGQEAIQKVSERCWGAEGKDRGYAALALTLLWRFSKGGIEAVIAPYAATFGQWISQPSDGAYGFGYLLNSISGDQSLTHRILGESDPVAIANACSEVTTDNASEVAELMQSIGAIKDPNYHRQILKALSRKRLLEFAGSDAHLTNINPFAHFCASILWLDEDLALEMAEHFVPVGQKILATRPLEGFAELSHELTMYVLRIYDPLGVYVGNLKPSQRQWKIARGLCRMIDPVKAASEVSQTKLRRFQSTAEFLSFLSDTAPRKFEEVVRHLDWAKLDATIDDDWTNMSHDTEVMLSTLYARPKTRHFVLDFISSHIDRIRSFPPRLMLMAPEAGIAHVARGGVLRLAQYNHVSWGMGGLALGILTDTREDLVHTAVKPFVSDIARSLSNLHNDHTDTAEGFCHVVSNYAPVAWTEILNQINPDQAEVMLITCMTKTEDHRLSAATIVESALDMQTPIGDVARKIRARFPKASKAPSSEPRFGKVRFGSRRKKKPLPSNPSQQS